MHSQQKSGSRTARQLGLLAALVVLVVCAAASARAERPPAILVIDEGAEGLARKVRAESMHIGLAVIEVEAGAGTGTDLARLERSGAVALVRISSEDQVEVLVARTDQQGLYSETLRRRPGEDDAFAVRVVEQVRARLVELHVWTPEPATSPSDEQSPSGEAPSRVRSESPLPAESATTNPKTSLDAEADRGPLAPGARRAPPRLWLDGGAGGTLPAGGVGPAAHGVLGARFEPDASWGIAAHAFVPLLDGSVRKPEGEADLSASLFTVELAYSLELRAGWLAAAGLGAGLLSLAMSGEASRPYVARDDRLTAGVYYAHASAGRWLASWLRIRAGLLAGFSAPRPVVRFDDREVASWGRAFAGMVLQAEVGVQ